MTSENTWEQHQGRVEEDEQDDLRGYDLEFKCSHDICKMQPDTNIYKGCVVMRDKNYMKRIHNCSNYQGKVRQIYIYIYIYIYILYILMAKDPNKSLTDE